MSCDHSAETHLLLDGESKDRANAEKHLADCVDCQGAFHAGVQLRSLAIVAREQMDADRETATRLLDLLSSLARVNEPFRGAEATAVDDIAKVIAAVRSESAAEIARLQLEATNARLREERQTERADRENDRADAAEIDAAQARSAVLRTGRDPKWAAVYAWFDDHKDAMVKRLSDETGRLEREVIAARACADAEAANGAALRTALISIQWSYRSPGEPLPNQCPECGGIESRGHDSDCRIGIALAPPRLRSRRASAGARRGGTGAGQRLGTPPRRKDRR